MGTVMGTGTAFDHGELNIPLSKRYGKGGIDAAIDRYKAEQFRADAAEHKAILKAARDKEAARVRLTVEDLAGVTHVRDQFGWHKVVRVNTKTVTVETGYSWTDTIKVDKILEGRTI